MKIRPYALLFPIVALGVMSALATQLTSQTAAPSPLTMLSRDGRRSIPLVTVGNELFVALDDLVPIFQLTVREDALNAVTVTYKGKTIVLTPDQPLASVAGRLVSLPAAPSRSGRRWLVPVEFINRALGPVYDSRLDLRKGSLLLVVGDVRVPRVTIRYEPAGGGGRLTIDAAPRAPSTVSQDGQRVTIKFDADALDVSNPLVPPAAAPDLVAAVRQADATTLTLDLGPRAAGIRAQASPPTDAIARTVIDLLPVATAAPPTPDANAAVPPAPAPAAAAPDLPPGLSTPTSPIRTIALDPGHGGEDEGVHGAGGTKEKDLNLAVARRIKAAIEGRLGVRVLLTREDDHNVAIDERTALANNNKADLFVSLHANASFRPTLGGAAIFLAEFDAETVKAAGEPHVERLPAFGGGLRDIELVSWDLAQSRHLDQSTAFAGLLESQLQNRIPLGARPRSRAPLRVLESANMPAVLIEMGYLSNPEQEKQLSGNEFQTTFVQAFVEAVIKFRDSLLEGAR